MSKRIRVTGSILFALAGVLVIVKGGFLAFLPVNPGGGFVGEEMFYAGALQLMAAGMLAAALLAWFLAFLLLRPLLPALRRFRNLLVSVVGAGLVASPFLILSLRNISLIYLGVFALVWGFILPFLCGATTWLSGRSRSAS
jgi:hypothetical protein